jgi:hypothetical protein
LEISGSLSPFSENIREIQRDLYWIPAFAGMTSRKSKIQALLEAPGFVIPEFLISDDYLISTPP